MPAIQAINNNYDAIASIGIEPASMYQFAHTVGKFNDSNGLKAIDKNYKGKIFCYVDRKTSKGGIEFTTFTVGTNKHGQETFYFTSYNESKGDTDYTTFTPAPIKPRVVTQKELDAVITKENALKRACTLFDGANSQGVSEHPYIVAKKVNASGCDLRIINGRVVYALQNIDGNIISFQSTDAASKKKLQKDCESGGGFNIIGGTIADCANGFIACEGLSTGLTAYHNAKLNPKKKPVVVCVSSGNLGKVIGAFIGKFDNADVIELLADNDCDLNESDVLERNTGILAALKVCNQFGIKSFYLPFDASDLRRKVDFNDVQTFEVVEAPTGHDLSIELLKVAPAQSLQKLFDEFAKDVIFNTKPADKKGKIAAGYYSIKQCVDILNNALTVRDGLIFDVINKVSIAVAKHFAYRNMYLVNDDDINDVLTKTMIELDNNGIECDVAQVQKYLAVRVAKSREQQRKLKTITDNRAFNDVMDVNGLGAADVAFEMEIESQKQKTLFVDNRGMNGFKTQTLVELAPYLKGGIAYISPLVSVCKQAAERMQFSSYQDVSLQFLEAHSHKINAVFCINSIPKFNLSQHFDHAFIDELSAVYESIFDDTGTNKHQQKKLIDELSAFLSKAKTIVISDAGMNSNHVAWIQSLAGNAKTILLNATPPKSSVNHYLLQNHAHSHELILRDVKAGKRGVIACDNLANALAVKKILSSVVAQIGAMIDINRVLLATGENNGELDVNEFIEKPNENDYRYDVIIHSPIVRSGTSINTTDYEFSYLLYDGIVSTSDAMQMWGRCRNAQNRYVSFGTQIDRTRITDLKLLLEIESDELEQKGYDKPQANELARRRHAFTAQLNADKNDYKNNFLLHCELTGREIIRLESDVEIDKKLSAEVKEKRCHDRFNAEVISESEYKRIKSSNKRWQSETDSMKRYETVLMVHGDNAAVDSEITLDDVVNELDGMLKPLLMFESLTTDVALLKALDKADKQNDCLKFSRVKLQQALNETIDTLKGKTIGKVEFNECCNKLEKHKVILAAAGLGKFSKINRKRAGFTVGVLLEKLGYEMAENEQNNNGERFYKIFVNESIDKYAESRKAVRL